jgi:beta-glucosidase/6-phospho-beta-glucosidase/beta-galactosidase
MPDCQPVLRFDFMWGFATAAAQIESGSVESEAQSGKEDSVSRNLFEITRQSKKLTTYIDLGRILLHSRED